MMTSEAIFLYVATPQYQFRQIHLAVIFSACCVYPNSLCVTAASTPKKSTRSWSPLWTSRYLWSPNSPDLSSVDYKNWNIIQQQVHQTKLQDVNDLRQRLTDVFAGVERSVIGDAIDLHVCLWATWGYFEYSLWQKVVKTLKLDLILWLNRTFF